MSTTQRSEGINSFFDKYVNKKTTLREFIEKYHVAVEDRKEAKKKADFSMWLREPILNSPSPFEKQLSTIYTPEIFKKFQVEVLGVFGCHPRKVLDSGTKIFEVKDFEKHEDFEVEWNEEKEEVSCLCHLFEYNGYLCRHALSVLQQLGIFKVPFRYILKRWTRFALGNYEVEKVSKGIAPNDQWYRDLLYLSSILCREGSICLESYGIASQAIKTALEQCKSINGCCSNQSSSGAIGKENMNCNVLLDRVGDPKLSKTKGAPKRIKSSIEMKRKAKKQPQVSSLWYMPNKVC